LNGNMLPHSVFVVALAGACLALVGALTPYGSVRAQTLSTFKVMDWNIQHGVDTSGVNNLDRVATWIATVNPDVVSLNEVEKQNGYNSNADEPAVLKSLLEAKTGRTWYSCFAQRTGAAAGQGNLLLTRIPIESCVPYLLSASRSVARAKLTVNGVAVSAFSTHLDDASASTRATQVDQLTSWASSAPEQRIIMGDFNASASSSELQSMKAAYDDTWAVALSAGTAVGYPGNEAGNTRNGRIDYIWRSKGATQLVLQSVRVYDTGGISDHRPLAATFSLTTAPDTLTPPGNLRIVR
jgi:endonuclease/exonuclease/phosphatase family metal-dependent hydrolase